jgi:hypothetical protein
VTVQPPVGATRVIVHGVLSPTAEGHPGTYEFLYKKGSASCEGEGKAPESPGIMLGFEHEEVTETLTGLQPSTKYTVCLLARNPKGEETISPAVTFTTALALEAPTTTSPATEITATTATLLGVLNPGAAGEAGGGYQFVYRPSATECEGELATPEQEPTAGLKGEKAEAKITELQPNKQYTFCLLARNAAGETALGSPVTFTTEARKPEIEGETFSQVGPHGASVTAQVNMANEEGGYYYLYGTESEFEAKAPRKTKEVKLAANGEAVPALALLTGLEPNTEYDFRLVVTNTSDQLALGDILAFNTLPESSPGLPDNRAYEMVTPVENDNADVFVPHVETFPSASGTPTFRPFQASSDGTAVTYVADSTVGGVGTSAAGAGNQYMARRLPGGGWVQSNIEPEGRRVTEYQGFTSDLSTGVVLSGKESAPRLPPLVPGTPGEGYPLLYACDDSASPCTSPEESLVAPQDPFQALFTGPLNRAPAEFGTQGFGRRGFGVIADARVEVWPVFAGAAGSASGGLLFEANDALLRGGRVIERELTESVKREIANSENSNYLYDSVGGRLGLVDVLPAGEGGRVVGDATFGGPPFAGNEFDPPDFSGVISGDGSRVYWTDLHSSVVYVRVDGSSTTRVSAGAAQYWASAADGRYAFYDENGELYRFDAETDSREVLAGTGAGTLGVIGVSGDGSSVYFVAGGILPGASTNGEGSIAVKEQPNLYVSHYTGTSWAPVFIATLSPQDGSGVEPFRESRSTDSGLYGDWQPALSNRTAGVPAGGGGVVFMSSMSLPVVGFPKGYPSGGAQEVYVFDAGANRLFCVSCSASGEAPPATLAGAAAYLPISWTDTYSMPWISDDGDRVFFDSAVPLAPQDTNGVQDVYEWEREGTGGCPAGTGVNGGCVSLLSGGTSKAGSWFVGASANGDDVFIVTRAQLVPEDQNGADDLYDVRVDGVRPVSPPACTGTGCQGVPALPPTFATPPSVTFNGVGNFPPPAPTKATVKPKAKPKAKSCKRGYVKKKGKCVRKKTKARKSTAKGRKRHV